MPAYDGQQFQPPAPVALVTLRNPQTNVTATDVPMLLDTGADVTLLSQAVVERLGVVAIPDQRYELVGFDGSTSFAPIVRVDLLFLGRRFRGQFLLIDQAWGILGLNVLNQLPLMYDGPRLLWEEVRKT
jgi:predicted aspartyl protease